VKDLIIFWFYGTLVLGSLLAFLGGWVGLTLDVTTYDGFWFGVIGGYAIGIILTSHLLLASGAWGLWSQLKRS